MKREHLRNSGAKRQSHAIQRVPGVNIHHATRYATRIGLPLDNFITINMTQAGWTGEEASAAFRKVLAERFSPWLRRNPENDNEPTPTYVWALEGAGGQHAIHWIVHIPAKLKKGLKAKLERWLAADLEPIPPSAIDIRPVTNIIGARRYILKGISPLWADHLGVIHVPQGLIVGKRSGFSKNLGPLARKRGGYRPKRVVPAVR